MAHYYFVSAALPSIAVGVKPEITFKELQDMLALNLTSSDLKEFQHLLSPIDLYNIKALWLGIPLDEKGTFDARDLEEALLVRDSIPSYIVDFLDRFESTSDRLRNFSFLYASLYQQEWKGFFKKYFILEREIRLVLMALRVKKTKRDIVKELQFEDPYDAFVMQILAQKDAPDYTPPREYEDLKSLFIENDSEPKKLAKALLEYRFKKIEEIEENEHFTLNQILGYAARLLLVESWDRLDQRRGRLAVEELSKYE